MFREVGELPFTDLDLMSGTAPRPPDLASFRSEHQRR